MAKVGFYYTHYQCLGHITRVLSLLTRIKKRFSSAVLFNINASVPQPFLKLPLYIKNYVLPYPFFDQASFSSSICVSRTAIAERSISLLSFIKKHKLDILITEFFPFGRNICKYELLPSLKYLRKDRKKIVSSIGYPLICEDSISDAKKLIPIYDKVFIHTPPIELQYFADSYSSQKQKNEYREFFNRFSEKLVFTGYIMPFELEFSGKEQKSEKFKKDKIKIFVTRGGGTCYPNIIAASICASDLLSECYSFIIISGPSTTESEWQYFQALMAKKSLQNVILIKCASNIKYLMQNCDICIATSSYHSSASLLKFRKRAILIPFEGYKNISYREQTCRANLLRDFIASSIIRYRDLTPERLAKEIARKVKESAVENNKSINSDWFRGGQIFIKEFSGLYDKKN